jgi:hypothetical protein
LGLADDLRKFGSGSTRVGIVFGPGPDLALLASGPDNRVGDEKTACGGYCQAPLRIGQRMRVIIGRFTAPLLALKRCLKHGSEHSVKAGACQRRFPVGPAGFFHFRPLYEQKVARRDRLSGPSAETIRTKRTAARAEKKEGRSCRRTRTFWTMRKVCRRFIVKSWRHSRAWSRVAESDTVWPFKASLPTSPTVDCLIRSPKSFLPESVCKNVAWRLAGDTQIR